MDVRRLGAGRRGLADRRALLCRAGHGLPHAGGDYHFLRRAYGRSVAFLFAWARFSVITTGSIALLAFVFGDYMQQALPLRLAAGWGAPRMRWPRSLVLSAVNLRGIRPAPRRRAG